MKRMEKDYQPSDGRKPYGLDDRREHKEQTQ
jgi:hypothetical protein